MKRMKKFLVAFLVLSFMLPTLASCNNAEQAETTTEAEAEQEGGQSAANEAVEGAYPLELWTFQELHVDFYVDMADKWNEKYPDKPIELTVSQQTSSAMHTKMLVALTSGEGGPDISDIEVGHFANFIKPDDVLLLPLNDVIEPEKDNVVMSRQEMYSDEQGNIYGIDFHVGMTVSYYNMDIMNEAGVDPNSIETWEDYANVGKTVLEATGKPMTIVETGDLFLPQCMLLEKNVQYVTDAGEPNIATSDHADVLAFIRSMLAEGTIITAPGGGVHEEEFYGFFNDGGAASLTMPLWYMGRFTDYMTDLDGKMEIHPIPVWNSGDVRGVTQGGTGTAVTKQAEDPELAKEFLAYSKLSEEGNRYIWEKLGFDPIRTELWTDPTITEDPDNKFLQFFINNPLDVLNEIGPDVPAPNIRGSYSSTYNVLTSTTYVNAFELALDTDSMELLEQEQATILE